MKPENIKSLVHVLREQMHKLDNDDITAKKAITMAKLSDQILKAYQYELNEVDQKMAIYAFNQKHATNFELKILDGKPFDNTGE